MRFSIYNTPDDVISGWVSPDDPRAISRVAVSVAGQRVAEVTATGIVPVLRQNGWHATGQCEFLVDDSLVPGLAGIGDLEVHDIDSNLLLYRRCSTPGLCQGKLALINASIYPERTLQAALFPYFRYSYFGIGKFSEQIMTNLLDPVDLKSLFMSGNFIFTRYELNINTGELNTALLVHDPFVEMASRMIWLRERADLGADPAQSWRLGGLAEAAAFAKDYDYTDIKQVKRFLRMLPQTAYLLLYNPLTRQLGTYLPEDQMMPGHSVQAVEALARVGIVGHHDYFEAFATSVFDSLGIVAPIPAPAPYPKATIELAEYLRSIKAARDFVIFDVAISDGVRRSVARSWTD